MCTVQQRCQYVVYKFNCALWIVLLKADKLLKSTTDGDRLFHTDTALSAK